jgi:hypothetical protein
MKSNPNQAFPQYKSSLPQLTPQDLKVIFAHQAHEHPQTTVVFKIPLNYDILCPQGMRDWKSQRAVSIEQSDITTIKTDNSAANTGTRVTVQPVDHFETLDAKVREIEQDAELMERDLLELGIPELAHPPAVEPLFTTEFDHCVPVIDHTVNMSHTQTLSARREVAAFTKASQGRTHQRQASRTKEKIRMAKEVLAANPEGPQKRKRDESRAQKRESTTGRVDWPRVIELMQGDTF